MSDQDYIPTKLLNQGKELPFKVPNHYFNDFPARLQFKLEQQETTANLRPRSRMVEFFRPALGLAAAFAAVFLLVYVPVKTVTKNQPVVANSATVSGMEENIRRIIENVDENTFYTLLETDTITLPFKDDELVNYLASNYNDLEIFIETSN